LIADDEEPRVSAPATTERKPVPRQRRQRARRGFTWTPRRELLLVALLFAAALAARWPYLLRLPHLTDETVEIRWALEIWRGQRLPLTASDAYYGPLHAYIVAACLWLFGPHVILPRLIVMIAGALTVGVTYLLGRELAGRWVGALGAALLATNPQHIVVNSHVAWQNSTTPFYSTLCCWALVRALNFVTRSTEGLSASVGGARGTAQGAWDQGGRWLVLSGLCYGLTLQTHVGTVVLAPALAATVGYVVIRRRAWRFLRSPWPYAAVLAAIVGYAPVLIYNATHRLAGVVRVQTRRDYAFEGDPSWANYWHNFSNLLFELARMISNPFRIPARRFDYLTSPYMLIAVALAGMGLLVLARRGRWLPPLAVLSTAAIMPYFNHAYGVEGDRYFLTGRYVAFLLPLLAIATAIAVLTLVRWCIAAVPRRWQGLALRDAATVAPVVLAALLILYPLLPLERYYTHEAVKDPANASFLETLRVVNTLRGPRTPVLLDAYFNKVNLRDGAEALDILDLLLTLDRVPHQIVDDPGTALRALEPTLNPADRESLPLAIMPRDRCWPLQNEIPLQRVSDTLLLNELYRYYAVYRYAPPPAPAACRTADQQGQ
jgi:4-amino-4-deoxy-L-arabinose transferase-like glycosyltransferase